MVPYHNMTPGEPRGDQFILDELLIEDIQESLVRGIATSIMAGSLELTPIGSDRIASEGDRCEVFSLDKRVNFTAVIGRRDAEFQSLLVCFPDGSIYGSPIWMDGRGIPFSQRVEYGRNFFMKDGLSMSRDGKRVVFFLQGCDVQDYVWMVRQAEQGTPNLKDRSLVGDLTSIWMHLDAVEPRRDLWEEVEFGSLHGLPIAMLSMVQESNQIPALKLGLKDDRMNVHLTLFMQGSNGERMLFARNVNTKRSVCLGSVSRGQAILVNDRILRSIVAPSYTGDKVYGFFWLDGNNAYYVIHPGRVSANADGRVKDALYRYTNKRD